MFQTQNLTLLLSIVNSFTTAIHQIHHQYLSHLTAISSKITFIPQTTLIQNIVTHILKLANETSSNRDPFINVIIQTRL